MRKILLFLILFLAIAIAFLNQIAFEKFLYWRFWWFDIMMHFLGGLCISLAVLWFYFYSGFFKSEFFDKKNKTNILFISVEVVLIIGCGWEIFEFFVGSIGDLPDTIKDLIMDSVGAILAAEFFLFNFYKKSDRISLTEIEN